MVRDPKDLDKDEAPLLVPDDAAKNPVPDEQSNEIPKHGPKHHPTKVPLPAD
jgi:hypothetical protein